MFEQEIEKASTLQDVAQAYQVDRRTFYNWIKPIKQELLDMYPVKKAYISFLLPKQKKRIVDFLG